MQNMPSNLQRYACLALGMSPITPPAAYQVWFKPDVQAGSCYEERAGCTQNV